MAGYASPFGAALQSVGDNLMQILVMRQNEKRQKLLDEIMQKDRESLMQSRELNNKLGQEQLASVQEQRDRQAGEGLAKVLPPGADLDIEGVETLRKAKLSPLVRAGRQMAPRAVASPSVDGSLPSTQLMPNTTAGTFSGTAEQIEKQGDRERLQAYLESVDPESNEAKAVRYKLGTGDNAPSGVLDKSSTSQTSDIQNYEYEMGQRRNAGQEPITFEQWRQQKAEQGVEGRPYFSMQPVFDNQGRPIGAVRLNARTGGVELVDISALTNGGQLKPPPGNLGQQSILNEASLDQLDRLKTMFDEGAKDLIGPVEGRARSFGQQMPLVPVNTDFAGFEAASTTFKNAVIKAITGAQMSEPEAKRIMEQVPTPKDKPEVWIEKYKQTVLNLQDLENRLKTNRPNGAAPPAAPANNDPLGIRK